MLLAGFFLVPPARAATLRGGGDIVIGPNEVINDDVYASGRTVLVQGRIRGDLYAFAQRVLITGQVDGDVVAFAQVIDVSGRVGDDMRVAGQVVRVAGDGVGDDLLAAGLSVEVARGTPVGGDVIAGASQILIAGDVGGNTLLGANGVDLQGHIQGDAKVSVGEGEQTIPSAAFLTVRSTPIPQVAPGLTVGENAVIGGKLRYESLNGAHISPSAHIAGGVRHILPRQLRTRKKVQFGTRSWVYDQIRRFVVLLLVGWALFFLYGGRMRKLGRRIHDRPLASLGWGIVGFFGFIAAILVTLLATGVLAILFHVATLGLLAGWTLILGLLADVGLVVAYYFFVTFVVPATVPYALFARVDRGGLWWLLPVTVGLLLYVGLTALPYAGSFIAVLAILVGVGGVVLRWRPNGSPAPPEAAEREMSPTPPTAPSSATASIDSSAETAASPAASEQERPNAAG